MRTFLSTIQHTWLVKGNGVSYLLRRKIMQNIRIKRASKSKAKKINDNSVTRKQ